MVDFWVGGDKPGLCMLIGPVEIASEMKIGRRIGSGWKSEMALHI